MLAEARSEAKLSSALGEIRAEFGHLRAEFGELKADVGYVRIKLDAVERSTTGLKGTVITTGQTAGVGAVAIVIGVLAYGQTSFGIGVSTRDVIKASVSEYRQQEETTRPQSPAPK